MYIIKLLIPALALFSGIANSRDECPNHAISNPIYDHLSWTLNCAGRVTGKKHTVNELIIKQIDFDNDGVDEIFVSVYAVGFYGKGSGNYFVFRPGDQYEYLGAINFEPSLIFVFPNIAKPKLTYYHKYGIDDGALVTYEYDVDKFFRDETVENIKLPENKNRLCEIFGQNKIESYFQWTCSESTNAR